MKIYILIFLLTFINLSIYAQNCDCATNFKWLKETFEKNDAGYAYVIKKKGQQSYNYLNQDISRRAEATNSYTVCRDLMVEWLKFFRKYHLSISLSDSLSKIEAIKNIREFEKSVANIPKATFDAHEKYFIADDKWNNYLSTLNSESIEGVWSSPPYTIGIIKNGGSYLGFVINAPGTPFRKGDLKLKIQQSNTGYIGTTYTKDFKPVLDVAAGYNHLGPNYLFVGSLSLKRLAPTYPDPPQVATYQKSGYYSVPYLEKLSNKTVYFKIPSFNISQKKQIDSIIFRQKDLLSSTENLIIDLRGNGGGSDYAYQELLPFLYTTPIRNVGVEYKSTLLNNQYLLRIAQDSQFDAATRKSYKDSYDTLQKHLNEFILLEKQYVTVDTLKKKLRKPLKVAILIDGNTGSSAEQFLIDAKQSTKVKVFGRPTLGSLDISNMTTTKSPSGDFILRYGISKSLRIPEYQVDDIGLMPDTYLDNSIPNYKWVSFVQSVLEN